MSWVKIITYALDGFHRTTHWLKRKKRRNEIKRMEKAVNVGDSDSVAKQLRKLREKAKAKDDGR